jgi:hypothetical protein
MPLTQEQVITEIQKAGMDPKSIPAELTNTFSSLNIEALAYVLKLIKKGLK